MSPRWRRAAWLALMATALTASGVLLEGYSLRLLNLACLNVIAVIGLNLAFGYCGIIHLGQAAFVGIGAYVSALLTVKLGWPIFVGIPIALVSAAASALLLGGPLTRIKGHYLALATVGINVVLEQIARNWIEVTNGYNGIAGIPRVADFARLLSPEHAFLPISGGAMLLTVWLAVRLRDSQIGRAMIAVRDDEIAAASVGIDVARTKMTAFVLSGLCGALSGALFAHYTGFISPSDFAASQSILFLMMLVVGGEGAVIGAIFGALALTFLPELMRDAATGYIKLGGDEKAMITRLLKDGYLIIYGAITLLVLMVMPKGIAGLLSRWFGVDRWA